MNTADSASLSAQPLLQSLPPAVIAQLAKQPVIDLPSGAQVFERSAKCAGLPVILSGTVRAFKHLANGRSIELYRVTPSEPCILSLGCLLGHNRYPASGITYGPTRLIVMPPALFAQCLSEHAAFRTAMFRTLGDRLVNTMELVEEITTLRLDVRLASALLNHAETGDGAAQIVITHQELADELGTVREMVSRLLDEFARQGMVSLGRGRIQIVDPARLKALANTR